MNKKTLEVALKEHNYRLFGALSTKCFPSTFLVYSDTYKEEFACKVVSKKSVFENEVNCLKSLYHSCIVKLYEYFEYNETYFLILEYCPDGDLLSLIKSRVRPRPDVLLGFALDLASAIKYMHNKRFAHLDIKPSNVLVGKYGKLKLADFGLAKHFNENICTSYVGTSGFMAPEVKKNRPYNPFKADMWGFGGTLYYMIFGLMPLQLANKESGEIIIPISMNISLTKVLQRTLVADADERADINEVIDILQTGFSCNLRNSKTIKERSKTLVIKESFKRSMLSRNLSFIHKSGTVF